MEYQTFIFIGKSGTGKGTQAKRLAEYFESKGELVCNFSTGVGLRALRDEASYTGELVRETLGKGSMQPLFLAVWLWGDVFVKNITGKEHLICDGFPRRVPEAQALSTAMEFYKRGTVHVINLELPDEAVYERLLARGRQEDTREGIAYRLDWFKEEVAPVIAYFRSSDQYVVHNIDANRDKESIFSDIKKSIGLE